MDNFSKDVMQLIQAKLGNEVTVNLEHICILYGPVCRRPNFVDKEFAGFE